MSRIITFSILGILLLLWQPVTARAGLAGDLDGNGVVSIAEVQTVINAFLAVPAAPQPGGTAPGLAGDLNGDGVVSIAEVQAAINAYLGVAVSEQFTAAVLKLSSTGVLPQGSSLSGIEVTVQLPAGVTVGADGNNVVNAGVVTASGAAVGSGVTPALHTPATATLPGTLQFLVWSNVAAGFGVGEFATVNCLVARGNFPTAGDFILSPAGFKPADLLLQPVDGLTATLSARFN